MTVGSATNKITYAGNGSTVSFSTSFTFASDSEVDVILVTNSTGAEVAWTGGTQYNLVGAGTGNSGTLTVDTSPTDYTPATGETLVIQLLPSFTQGTALPRGGTVSPKDTLEAMHDNRVRQILRIKDQVDLSLKVSVAESSIAALPNVANRATFLMGFDASGDPTVTQSTLTQVDNLAGGVSQYLAGVDGTVSLPFYSFTSDPDSGFYRIGANNMGLSLNGTRVIDYSTTGVGVTGTLTASGTLVASGALTVATTAGITGVLTMGADIVSDTDSTDDLGTTGVRWANLFVDDITVTDDILVATAPTLGSHATNKTYVDNAIVGLRNRRSVQVASTANVALANALENGDTLDGIVLVTGDLVLLKNQTATQENGVYVAVASGAASRDTEFDAYDEHPGSMVVVEEGTANSDTIWLCTSDEGGTIDVTAIAFSQVTPASTNINSLTDVTITAAATNDVLVYNGGAWVDNNGVAFLAADQTWSGAQRATVTALTSSSNAIAIDFSASNDFSHTFTENTALSAGTGTEVAGQHGTIFFTQHASSPKTLDLTDGSYIFAAGTESIITATNSAKDSIDYRIRADGVVELSASLALA